MDTFITSFGTIYSVKSISIDLTNCFFKHAIIGINVDLESYKSDPFIYISSERYTLDKLYEIILDTRASKRSIAGYEQYLAYKK